MSTQYPKDDTYRRLTRKSLEEMEELFERRVMYYTPGPEWSVTLWENGWTTKEWRSAHRPK